MTGFDRHRVTAAYDAVATEYADAFGHDLAQLAFDRDFLTDLADRVGGTSGRVLDVGCGPGQVGSFVADRGPRVVGVDLSIEMLRVARETHPAVRVVAADIRHLPVGTGRCDGVVAFYALPFLPREDLPAALAEVRRVVRRGGVAGFATHVGAGEIHGPNVWFDHPIEPLTLTLFDDDELARALDGAGLAIISSRRRDPLPHEHQGPRLYVLARVP